MDCEYCIPSSSLDLNLYDIVRGPFNTPEECSGVCKGTADCSRKWNPDDCVDATISPSFVDDGKLPSGTLPNSVSVKISKKIYVSGQVYEHNSTNNVWINSNNDSLSIINGLISLTHNGMNYSLIPSARYRDQYKDYTIADGYYRAVSINGKPIDLLSQNNISDSKSRTYCGRTEPTGITYEEIYDLGVEGIDIWPIPQLVDSSGAFYCGDSLTSFEECCISLGFDGGGGPLPFCWKYGTPCENCTFANDLGEITGDYSTNACIYVPEITFESTCRKPDPTTNCSTCVNSPSTEYTTLTSYPNYFSGCTGRAIDIDYDRCSGVVKPTESSFTKRNFVLYYQGGASQPFLVIDNIAYDPRQTNGLIKVFTTNSAEEMRTMVCERLRFATLVDESKLSTDIGSALNSNWPYNDLYWYSECGNLPDEVPINLIPC